MNGEQFSSALARLHYVIESLDRVWAETRNSWDDSTRDELESRHLNPILQQLNSVIEATMPLRECFVLARRECDPKRHD